MFYGICVFQGYYWAGLQYGYECWCGDEYDIQKAILPENDASEDECDTVCPGYNYGYYGYHYEYCGGYYRMAVYHICKFHIAIKCKNVTNARIYDVR